METEVSLLEALRSGSYTTSVITTYNASFSFYECVVLPRLVASGCRHNTLVVDAKQCLGAIADKSLCPRLAGYAYTLAPIRAAQAFHPKIALLTGPKRSLLCVGSHNVTMSGFGGNSELTVKVEVDGKPNVWQVNALKKALEFLDSWISTQDPPLPQDVLESFARARDSVPESGKRSNAEDAAIFFGNSPDGDSLWTLLREQVKGPVRSVAIIGAFFDQGLLFLKQVSKDFRPAKLTVGIQSRTVELPSHAKHLPNVRFVETSNLRSTAKYLHAKAIYIDTEDGGSLLAVGSANPSFPAWLAPGNSRNAESVMVLRGQQAREHAESLGLTALLSETDLSVELWREAERPKPWQRTASDDVSAVQMLIAVEADDGFCVEECRELDVEKARCKDEEGIILHESSPGHAGNGTYRIHCPASLRAAVRTLEFLRGENTMARAIVHHTTELRNRAQTGKQAQLRAALASLGGDNPDLLQLLKSVERIIFTDAVKVTPTRARKKKIEADDAEGEHSFDSLGVNLEEPSSRRGRHRLAKSGDIGHLLDVLIHHIGYGLEGGVRSYDPNRRSEEELIDSDDETPSQFGPKDERIDTCQRKVRTLVTRMTKRFELIPDGGDECAAILVQLVAVLALLRELRMQDGRASWIPRGETFVPVSERKRLLESTCTFLFARGREFLMVARDHSVLQESDELGRLSGLLLWLAWDCGLQASKDSNQPSPDLATEEELQDKARLIAIDWGIGNDELAKTEARKAIEGLSGPARARSAVAWMEANFSLARKLAELRYPTTQSESDQRNAEPGDIAWAMRSPDRVPRVVLRNVGRQVWLVNLGKNEKEMVLKYVPEKVAVLIPRQGLLSVESHI